VRSNRRQHTLKQEFIPEGVIYSWVYALLLC